MSTDRDALDAAMDALELLAIEGSQPSKGAESDAEWRERYDAARAAVRRLAEQGEVMEVVGHRYHIDGRPTLTVAGLYGEQIQTGTKVRVTRIEEAP